jgi:hypothetical protein
MVLEQFFELLVFHFDIGRPQLSTTELDGRKLAFQP